ncbi:MAG TPA: PEP-CTERM sorting domain-containing protein [Caulifigura sp.]|nr:PEP-CTERM sorting domain-containing protein [Caulifigura sp.]
MRFVVRTICCLAVVAGLATESFAGYAYMRSTVGQPWAQNTNELAMTAAFGAGNWSDLRYETAGIAAATFSAANTFVYMEGSELIADEMEAFLNSNQALIEGWVAGGGSLFINAAPNEGNGMNLGFGGVNLNYGPGPFSAIATVLAHPILGGPNLPTSVNYTGTDFAHATISSSGPVLSTIITGIGSAPILSEMDFGLGHVMFGGMTTTNFHSPAPQAFNLRVNILAYGAAQANVGEPTATPEPASMALLAMGVGGFACAGKLRRRKAVDAAL